MPRKSRSASGSRPSGARHSAAWRAELLLLWGVEPGTPRMQILVEDWRKIIADPGSLLLQCEYKAGVGVVIATHWYKTLPTHLQTTDLKQRSPDHPLLKVGLPREACPPAYR